MKRLEGMDKLTGAERYIDDESPPGCLWGMTVRSPSPRGRISEVRFSKTINWSEFVIVDHRDIPGPNEIYLIERDQPILAAQNVRHIHEPVVLLAHHSRESVRRAVREVEVVVEPEPPIFDFLATPAGNQVQHGSDNVLKHLLISKGDVDAAIRSAAHMVEGTYQTAAQEHVYLETQGMMAWQEGDALVIKGSMQCPYYVLNALTHGLRRHAAHVRVVAAPTGGGFGGKEDFPSNLALHVALLAIKSGRPVKMIYDRREDMAATTKRHPAWVRHRTGLDARGRLIAQDIEVALDGGAYVTLSPVVLSRGIIHAAGPYACDNVRIRGRAVFTNSVPYGAFRGFGAPQTLFANERHMDVIARRLRIDPAELRRTNLIRDGQTTATGQVIRDGTDRVMIQDRALELAAFQSRRTEHERSNRMQTNHRRGIGFATFFHGAGFTGGGEVYLASRLRVAGLPDGRIEIRSANTEMGQGTNTIFTQIAASALGLSPDHVVVAQPDTSIVPNSGPTVASRTAMVVGRLIEVACNKLKQLLDLSEYASGEVVQQAIRDWYRTHQGQELLAESTYSKPPNIHWDEKNYRGDAYGTFAWATYVAEVEVDLRTFNVRVLDFVAVQEVGKVLNDTLARGQIQGGVVQGIGWALMEDCKLSQGVMQNTMLTNYIIPTSADVPPIRVEFMENPYPHGGGGAKGIGELPIDGAAPAVLNAVADALGVEPTSIPLTPERLLELVRHAAVA